MLGSLKTFFFLIACVEFAVSVKHSYFPGPCEHSRNCHDICIEVKGGGHTCDCQMGYVLYKDGTSCVPDEHSNSRVPDNDGNHRNDLYGADTTGLSYSTPGLALHSGVQLTSDEKLVKKTLKLSEGELAGGALHNVPPNTKELKSLSRTDDRAPLNAVPRFQSCDRLFCLNGGMCVKDLMRGGVRCQCLLGFTGETCQADIETRYPKFKGNGFLAFPGLRQAYKDFTIDIEFRPETSNGLLLFTSEKPNSRGDFFSLALVDQGYVEFRFDCGTGMAIIRSRQKVILGQWNNVTIHRDEQNGWIKVNGDRKVHGKSKGAFSRITLRLHFYLGGYLNTTVIGPRTGIHYGFVGCVKSLVVNQKSYDMRKGTAFTGDAIHGIDVDECSAGVCNNAECSNGGYCVPISPDEGVCMCPMGYAGKTCTKVVGEVYVPKFLGHSYLKFEGLRRTVLSFSEIEIVFKPHSPDGVLFYNGYTTDRKGDFMSVTLVNGFVEFRFDLGTGAAILKSVEPIAMDEWHMVVFTRTGRDGVLIVDNQPKVEGLSEGAYTQLTLLLDMFIGGHENYDDSSKFLGISQSFQGCIQKVVINDRPLELLKQSIGGANIDNCDHPCSGAPCRNDGTCMPNKEIFTCSCPLGYENTNCETKSKKDITVSMFKGMSYLKYTDPQILKRVIGSKIDVRLRMKLSGPDGLIFWSGENKMSASSDYLALGVLGGHMRFSYNLGSGEVIIMNRDTKVDDGKWHWIHAQRDKQVGYLEIDGHTVVEGNSPGSLKQLNTNTPLFLGGSDDVSHMTMRKYSQGFSGCISNLTLATDYHIDLVKQAMDGRNIQECS